jgi:hypothetical protein
MANSPQVILSWVYFSYNGLLTLLALARECESWALDLLFAAAVSHRTSVHVRIGLLVLARVAVILPGQRAVVRPHCGRLDADS